MLVGKCSCELSGRKLNRKIRAYKPVPACRGGICGPILEMFSTVRGSTDRQTEECTPLEVEDRLEKDAAVAGCGGPEEASARQRQ
jgi:hypothetical protein